MGRDNNVYFVKQWKFTWNFQFRFVSWKWVYICISIASHILVEMVFIYRTHIHIKCIKYSMSFDVQTVTQISFHRQGFSENLFRSFFFFCYLTQRAELKFSLFLSILFSEFGFSFPRFTPLFLRMQKRERVLKRER